MKPSWTDTVPIKEHDVLDCIRKQRGYPTAIIVVGGNDENLEKVADWISSRLDISQAVRFEVDDPEGVDSIPYDTLVDGVCTKHSYMLVSMKRGSGADPGLRRTLVKRLREVIHADAVIAIWVKGDPECDNLNAQRADEELRQAPPDCTREGIDRLLTQEYTLGD